jgi:hypothetical protein
MHKISSENLISLSESFQNLPFYFVILLGIYEIILILKRAITAQYRISSNPYQAEIGKK